jgi:hypothetical protein
MNRIINRLMQHCASAHARAICDLLFRDTTGWQFGRNRVVHNGAQISLWVAGGLRGLRLEPIFIARNEPGPPLVLDAGTDARLSWVDRRLIHAMLGRCNLLDRKSNTIVKRVQAALVRQEGG